VKLRQLIGAALMMALGYGQGMAAGPGHCQTCQPISTNTPPCACCEGGHCCDGLCEHCPPKFLEPGRPTPPPCCADGLCYPKADTWGVYGTRWRQWPIQYTTGGPGAPGLGAPGQPGQAPPFVLPSPDEEDRRAPPPSVPKRPPGQPPRQQPREEGQQPEGESTTPPTETEGTPPGLPPIDVSPDGVPTPDSLFGPENTEETPSTTPLTPPPPSTDEAAPTTTPLGSPTGDADPPPPLPFATTVTARPVVRQVAPPVKAPQPPVQRPAQGDDPPPAYPLASTR
jgi:hypothetical protein